MNKTKIKKREERQWKSDLKEHHTWSNMKSRCLNKNNKQYKWYGARGITVCEKWLSFDGFYEDMSPAPPGHSLDRINNDLGYFKENCRWVTYDIQSRNKRNNRIVTLNGQKMCLQDAEKLIGIPDGFTQTWMNKHGLSFEDMLDKYVCSKKYKPRKNHQQPSL